jgi:transcription-repair coupling factor (superfamily II helicase)
MGEPSNEETLEPLRELRRGFPLDRMITGDGGVGDTDVTLVAAIVGEGVGFDG